MYLPLYVEPRDVAEATTLMDTFGPKAGMEAAERAVQTASQGESISQQSVQSVTEVDHALGGISESVSRISAMSQQMASAAEQQSHVAEDISRQITRIAQLSDHSAAQAQEGAQISVDLEQMAGQLHSLAERFNR